ncbi:MAG TPA: hypothetical protein VM573_04595 [Actinomycetota bacterium]|jgi:hypothetical protein|nr:hypothetical protein [Actinomycetota bacterium]
MRHKIRLITVAALVGAGLVAVTPASPAFACSGGTPGARHATEVLRLHTFEITMQSVKRSYKIGDVARIGVEVKRPAKHDPLGQGIPIDPPQQYPAADISVGIGLRIGDVFLHGFAYTDEQGKATIQIPIPKWVRPGRAMAVAQAAKRQAESPCLSVEEYGWTQNPNLFRVN